MNWFVFVIIGVLSISIANIFQRLAMREEVSDPLTSSIFFQFIVTFIMGIFAIFKGFVFPPILEFPINFAFSTLFYAMGTLLIFKAAKRIGASELTILSAFGTFVSILGGVIFLHEIFTPKEFLGTILIIISVLMVQNKLGLSGNKGLVYAILGTSCYALAVVSDTYILKRYDAVSYAVVISLLPGIALFLAKPSVITKFKNFVSQKYLKNIFIFGFFYSMQAIGYYSALNMGANVSQVSPIFKSSIILTIILAVIFLKEKEKLWIKLLSAGIVTIGVLLIK